MIVGPGAQLPAGTVFAGDFEVVRPLGEGGMGAVYVALQRSTGKARALKVMHPQLAAAPGLRERFAREATVGAKIESEHVVEVVAAGVDGPSQTPWIAMELLRGEDLAARIARGPVPLAQATEILRQAGHALAAAHRAGIVHRDLKPENLFLAASQREGAGYLVKVLDFGIARLLHEARAGGASTQALGSPMWMAPEQSEASDGVSPPTDVWALGLVMFALLTGKSFWLAGNAAEASLQSLLREVLFAPIPTASERARALGAGPLPPGFDRWFARAVVRDRAARFRDAAEAVAGFGPALAAQPLPSTRAVPPTLVWTGTLAGPPPAAALVPPRAPPRPPSRARYAFLALGAVALVVGGVAFARSTPQRQRRDGPTSFARAAQPPPPSATPLAAAPPAALTEPADDALPGSRPPTLMRAMDLPTRAVQAPTSPPPSPQRAARSNPGAAPASRQQPATPPPPAVPSPPRATEVPAEAPREALRRAAGSEAAIEALQRALNQVGNEEDKRRIQRQIDALRGG